MKDFLGFELKVGDRVVLKETNDRAAYMIGRITGFTAKKVRIHVPNRSWQRKDTMRNPELLIKILATPEEWDLVKFSAGID